MELLRNPIFYAVVVGGATYIYLSRAEEKKKSNIDFNLNRFMVAVFIGFVCWFVVHGYLNYPNEDISIMPKKMSSPLPFAQQNYRFVNDVMSTQSVDDVKTLMAKYISIPDKLPSIMIDKM